MKEQLVEIASAKSSQREKLNAAREYLQAYILRIIHDRGFFESNAFVGGTALRFLYSLPRFSEDLDFSQVKKSKQEFAVLSKEVKDELIHSGYSVTLRQNDSKVVQNALVRFSGLLYELGISPHKNQVFSIKLERDTNPPPGAVLETRIVNKFFPIAFLCYDIQCLFAGKFHALLARTYTKGRDFYDIAWYLSHFKDLEPNFTFLTNALHQSRWPSVLPTKSNWVQLLVDAVRKADWKKVFSDVENFLENESDVKIFTQDNVIKLIEERLPKA